MGLGWAQQKKLHGTTSQQAYHLWGRASGSDALQASWQATAENWACWLLAGQTGSRDAGRNLFGKEGAGAGDGVIPIRYCWADRYALLWPWNQTSREGLHSVFFQNCSRWEAFSGCRDYPAFLEFLVIVLEGMPSGDSTFLLWDFKAQAMIGSNGVPDPDLDFCGSLRLAIKNTMFEHKVAY